MAAHCFSVFYICSTPFLLDGFFILLLESPCMFEVQNRSSSWPRETGLRLLFQRHAPTIRMNTTAFSHFTPNHSQAYIALFRNVSNASDIKKRIISAATAEGDAGEKEREAVNFAFIDARLVRTSYSRSRARGWNAICQITSKMNLDTAIYQAILAGESQGGLRTKTVHSEILFYLNPTNNVRMFSCQCVFSTFTILQITEAIRRYGVSASLTDLLVVRIDSPKLTQDSAQDKMCKAVKGDLVPLSELNHVTDWTIIKKVRYLLSSLSIWSSSNFPFSIINWPMIPQSRMPKGSHQNVA